MSGETPFPMTPMTSDLVDPSGDAKLAKLVEMGFQVEESREALQHCQGDMEAACDLLASRSSTTASSTAAGSGGGFLSSLVRYSGINTQSN